jgi:hypothetical protein
MLSRVANEGPAGGGLFFEIVLLQSSAGLIGR